MEEDGKSNSSDSNRDNGVDISNSTEERAEFSRVESAARGWMLDFCFVSLCHYFKEDKLEQFNRCLNELQVFLEGSDDEIWNQERKREVCCFLERIVHGKQTDYYYASNKQVTPLMSAVSIWNSLEDTVVDETLFKNIKKLLFIQSVAVCMERGDYIKASWVIEWLTEVCGMPQNLRMKLSLIVKQKDTYHVFLSTFCFTSLVESVKSFIDLFLKEHPSDFLLKAASKVILSCQKTEDRTANSEPEPSEALEEKQKKSKKPLFALQSAVMWQPGSSKKPCFFQKISSRNTAVRLTSRCASPLKSENETKRRSTKKKWTWKEDKDLKMGVLRYGEGRWAKILEDFPLPGRTGVMLKDRWRTLKKLGEVKSQRGRHIDHVSS
ncbi:telomeric repeat-binding factor 1 isoform X1 [Scleropages formosus]|uniref:telomeric repeat-binding factor 1 isoform X1 n=1 Tax=Scleropages formosus TaxID=113540 RepID=UPI0010FA8A54|nr:telomeric repeat-binding factor 1 isoform X1 [Scleropages formosus]